MFYSLRAGRGRGGMGMEEREGEEVGLVRASVCVDSKRLNERMNEGC